MSRLGPSHLLAVVLLLGLCVPAARAAGSTSGTEFWTYWMESVDFVNDFVIAVANDSPTPAEVSISSPTRTLASDTVPTGDVRLFRFNLADRWSPEMLIGTERAFASYRITSDVPVTVHQFNTLLVETWTESHTHDASTVLPVTSLGPRYRISSWPEVLVQGVAQWSYLGVVAFAPEPTTVTIIPTAQTRAGDVAATPPGTPIVVTLERGEVLQVATDGVGMDLTGTVVQGDRPIAVFGGTRCSLIPAGNEWCDHLEEQLFPTQAWGRDFLAVMSKQRGRAIPDYWRILAQRDGTQVTLTPDPLGASPYSLVAGEFLEFSGIEDVHVEGTEPLQVTQYFAGSTYEGARSAPGDPSLMLTIPTEQFELDFLFVIPEGFSDDNVILVRPAGATIQLDGVDVPGIDFVPLGATGHEKAIVPVADGIHSVVASEPSMVYAFGYEEDTSYSFFVGGRPDPIGAAITCSVTATTPGPCDGGRTTLDASGSVGTPPLVFAWSSFTPGLVLDDPTAAVTGAQVPPGGGTAAVTISNAEDAVTCWVEVEPPPPPAPPPDVTCPARVTADATERGGAVVEVLATATATCEPVTLVNDRTDGGGDATDFYPCGVTTVRFTATDARGESATCTTRVEVTLAWVPGELSGLPWGVPLLVAKDAGGGQLRLTFEDLDEPFAGTNVYRGTLVRAPFPGYDHAPIECSVTPSVVSPGVQERFVPIQNGVSSYYVVSASTCGGEGSRGWRSDAVERPGLPTDCGVAR